MAEINRKNAAQGRAPHRWKTIPQGAATSVWAGIVADAEAVGARYCEDCHVSQIVKGENFDDVAEGVFAYALDRERAKDLWAKSEDMVGERF